MSERTTPEPTDDARLDAPVGEPGAPRPGAHRAHDEPSLDEPSLDAPVERTEAHRLEQERLDEELGEQARAANSGMFDGPPPGKAKNFGPTMKRLIKNFAPYKWSMIGVLILGAFGVILSVIGPKVLARATDIIFEGVISKNLPAGATQQQVIDGLRQAGQNDQASMLERMTLRPGEGIDFAALSQVLLLVLALYAISSFFMWLEGYVINRIVQATVAKLRDDVEAKIHRLPLSYYDRTQRGELMSRVTNDLDNVGQTLSQNASQVVSSLLTIVGVLIMMFSISWQLALVALITLPLTAIVTGVIAGRSQKQFKEQWKQTGKLNSRIEETFTGLALVKVFGREREARHDFATENERVYDASFKAQFLSGVIFPAMTFVGNLVYVAIAVVGGAMVAGGSIKLGDVQAFVQYSRQFTQPLAQLGGMMTMLQSGAASAERVFDLLDAEEERPDRAEAHAPGDGRGRIEFEHAAFGYSPDKPLITDLSLEVEPGQTIAIVGPTGAGKTTLVNLLMRFYELDSGRILLDGVDIAELSRRELREQTGMVLQDTWLFGGTIRENIAYGNEDANEEQIMEAARATFVDRFVHSLPDGYDTVLTEDAGNLSAGEKQLLTIARAFIAKPRVLILDEATSSVDTRTEVLVQQAMNQLREGRTSFVIAHRLSTIRDADRILVMEHGDIVEQGTHDELIERGGAYARLYNSQFEGALASAEATETGAIPTA